MMMMMRSFAISAFLMMAINNDNDNVNTVNADPCFGKTETTTKLNFENATVTENKVEDRGVLRYENIGFADNKSLDLEVSLVKGSYDTPKKTGYLESLAKSTLKRMIKVLSNFVSTTAIPKS